jgi:hypothetical protein
MGLVSMPGRHHRVENHHAKNVKPAWFRDVLPPSRENHAAGQMQQLQIQEINRLKRKRTGDSWDMRLFPLVANSSNVSRTPAMEQ